MLSTPHAKHKPEPARAAKLPSVFPPLKPLHLAGHACVFHQEHVFAKVHGLADGACNSLQIDQREIKPKQEAMADDQVPQQYGHTGPAFAIKQVLLVVWPQP